MNKTVLIVDDEPDLREILKMEFELADWRVLEAENGKRGIDVFRAQNVDAVISDVRMPGGSGIELLDHIKSTRPHVPVLLVTGFTDVQESTALAKGAFKVLKKPFDITSIVSLIEGAVSRG